MPWAAFLLFSPISSSAGQYQGRRIAKRASLPTSSLPSATEKAVEVREPRGEPVADALDAIKRDRSHGGQSCRLPQLPCPRVLPRRLRQAGAFPPHRKPGRWSPATPPPPRHRIGSARRSSRQSRRPHCARFPEQCRLASAPAQPMENTRSIGPPSSRAAKARVAAACPAPAQAAIHSSSTSRCAQNWTPLRVPCGQPRTRGFNSPGKAAMIAVRVMIAWLRSAE